MLFLHILGLGIACAAIFLADKEGLDWIRGRKETLDPVLTRRLHRLTWFALIILIGSGIVLTIPMASYLLHEPLFIMKMFFVAILCVNGVLIGRLMRIAHERPFAAVSPSLKKQLFVSGAISSISWAGAIILGLVLFF